MNQWDEFITMHAQDGGLLQSKLWADFNRALGRRVDCIEHRNPSTESEALIIEYALPFRQTYIYSPRGPVVSELMRHREEASGRRGDPQHMSVDCFTPLAMTEKVKHQFPKAIFWRVEPTISSQLSTLSSQPVKAPHNVQPRTTLVIDISKTEDGLLAQMKPKTRYNVRTAMRHNIAVRGIRNEELGIRDRFLDLLGETAKRDGFRIHTKEYYKELLSVRHCEESRPGRGDAAIHDRSKDCHTSHCSVRNDDQGSIELFCAFFGDQLLAGAIVAFFGTWAYYLHGASSSTNRELMAPYLLHWEIMREAKRRGCMKYDLWGAGEQWAGVSKFKTGFAPTTALTMYPGTFDIILDPMKYRVYRWAERLKRLNR